MSPTVDSVRPPRGMIMTPAQMDAGFVDGTLFDRTAYRLELLDWYTTPTTECRLARFLTGEQVTPAERAGWLSVLSAGRALGKSMARVHVVAEPLSDYLRYELACYESSVDAGEDIRILPAELAVGVDLPDFDYWLFDDMRVGVQYYGERGMWLRTEIVTEPSLVADCRRWRDEALNRAAPYVTYMSERRAT